MAAKNNTLTPLELKVMNLLWARKKAFVKDLLEGWDEDPKPAYNTVSTTVRILEDKGYIDHTAYGRTHEYFPTMDRKQYQKHFLKSMIDNVFSGSLSNLVSTIVDSEKLSDKDVEDLKNLIEKG